MLKITLNNRGFSDDCSRGVEQHAHREEVVTLVEVQSREELSAVTTASGMDHEMGLTVLHENLPRVRMKSELLAYMLLHATSKATFCKTESSK